MRRSLKTVTLFLLVLSLLILAVSCSTPKTTDFNKLLDKEYSSVNIEVKTEQEMGTLVSNYELSESEDGILVKYSCMSFVELSITTPVSERTKTLVGEALYKNGNKVSQSGDEVLFDIPNSIKPALNLSSGNMRNIQQSNGVTEADILNPSLLFGKSVSYTDTKIVISHTDEAIESIVITYVKSDVNSTLTFVFD